MSKEIWLLMKSGGQWEDKYDYAIRAYENKSDAECEMEKLNTELKNEQDNYKNLFELSEENDKLYCNYCELSDSCDACEHYVNIEYSDIDEQHPYSLDRLELIEDGE